MLSARHGGARPRHGTSPAGRRTREGGLDVFRSSVSLCARCRASAPLARIGDLRRRASDGSAL